jgi:Mg2+ and Co2+ transporter CorA
MIGTLAAVVLLPLTVGCVLGTWSGHKAGQTPELMWRSARWWYISWLVLLITAIIL